MTGEPENIPVHAGDDAPTPLRVGPARYVLDAGAVASLDRHLSDVASAYVLGGERAYDAVREDLDAALDRAGIDARYAAFGGECSPPEIADHRERVGQIDPDVLIAVGGGKALDTGKLAAEGRCSVVTIPTSPATCAAWTALSVVYESDGTYRTGVPTSRAPGLVVADLDVLAAAPARLFANGVMDAAAKHFETRLLGEADRPSHRWGARLAEETYFDDLRTYATPAYEDVRAGEVTPAVADAIETVLAGPGVAAGLLSDRSYVGPAHVVCYSLLSYGSVRAESYHGERVAYGVAVQQALSGDDAAASPTELLTWYGELDAELTLRDLGVAAGADVIDGIAHDVESKLEDAGIAVDVSPAEIAAAIRRVERAAADVG